MYYVTAAERGTTQTILSCVGASGFVLPPTMIFPRKQAVPDKCKIGCFPNTQFECSETRWVNSELKGEFFSKAYTLYIAKYRGRVITVDILASLVGEVYTCAFTSSNIMSGFRKSGLFPLNPSVADDRQLAPSKAFRVKSHTDSEKDACDTIIRQGVII